MGACARMCDSGSYLTVIRVCMCVYNEEAAAVAAAYGLCIIVIGVRHF